MSSKTSEELWTIAELAGCVSAALASNFDGVSNGRTRDIPDLRAIRYYTTLGLLDRPAEMRGRTAYYGRRHLCQLAAIKRLQAQGLSLADVQLRLLGLGSRELERLADLPKTNSLSSAAARGTAERAGEAVAAASPPSPAAQLRPLKPGGGSRRSEFWKQPAVAETESTVASESPVAAEVLALVTLAEGLSLGFPASREITQEDLEALRQAAEPMRQVLIQRRLIRPNPERDHHGEASPHSDRD